MSRWLVFAYGVVSYLAFGVTYLYAVGFVGNLVVPKSLDSAPTAPFGTALLINLGLLGLFAVQHSVMARPAFKRLVLRVLPQAAERSTYVLASSLALILLFWQWSPLGGVVWDVQNSTARAALYAAFGFGFLLVFVATVLINHFDLFGLRQVWLNFRGREYRVTVLRHARSLSVDQTPALPGMAVRLLGHAHDDRDAPAVRRDDDGLHLHRDSARRARPDGGASRIRGLQTARADDRPGADEAGARPHPHRVHDRCARPALRGAVAPVRPGAFARGLLSRSIDKTPTPSSRPCGNPPSASRMSQSPNTRTITFCSAASAAPTVVRWAFIT